MKRLRINFSFHGVPVVISTDEAELKRFLIKSLDGFPINLRLQRPEGSRKIRIWFQKAEGIKSLPPRARKLFRYFRVWGYEDSKRLYLTDGFSLVSVSSQRGCAQGWLNDMTLRRVWVFTNLLNTLLMELLRGVGFFHLHAAGLIKRADECILIPGKPLSGKTTLTIGLLRKGFNYLSDDVVLLNRGKQSKEIFAFSFRKDFHLDPIQAHRFYELRALRENPGFPLGKIYFSPAEFFPGRFRLKALPKVIIFPRIVKGKRSSLTPISSKEAFLKMLPQSFLIMLNAEVAHEHSKVLRDLVLQCKCFELKSGSDLHHSPELLSELIDLKT